MSRKLVYVYFNKAQDETEIFFPENGDIKTIDGCHFYNLLPHNSICWVSSTSVVERVYPGGEYPLQREWIAWDNTSEPLEYKYGDTLFRSFRAMIGGQDGTLSKIYNNEPMTVKMHKFVSMFGDPCLVKYTLAHNTVQKFFYTELKNELWEDTKTHRHFYHDLQTYDDMYAGNKAGLLGAADGCYKVEHNNVLMYDKKSAYASIFINGDLFPIGQIRNITAQEWKYDVKRIKYFIENRIWFKLLIEADLGLGDFLDGNVTALEYNDVCYCVDLHEVDGWKIIVDGMKNHQYRLYKSDETGYLNEDFRRAEFELYNIKNDCQNPAEKHIYKTQIAMTYGKGLQRHNFRDINDVMRHYKGRGDRYITPEFANHANSRLRYELLRAMYDGQGIYCDTDGIKVPDTPENRQLFETYNKNIIEKNSKSGFTTDIGVWNLEGIADRFCVFADKTYIFTENDELTIKAAGLTEEGKEVNKRNAGKTADEQFTAMLNRGLMYPLKGYDIVDGHFVAKSKVVFGVENMQKFLENNANREVINNE